MASFSSVYPRRGEVYWVDFPEPRRTEPGHRRPALIVSRNAGNQAGRAVIVAPITRTVRTFPEAVELPRAIGSVTGYVLCGQLLTVDKEALGNCAGRIDSIVQSKIDNALRSALSLS